MSLISEQAASKRERIAELTGKKINTPPGMFLQRLARVLPNSIMYSGSSRLPNLLESCLPDTPLPTCVIEARYVIEYKFNASKNKPLS